jgi:predicted ribosomally synthesized peptide with SipW-like signal peptide
MKKTLAWLLVIAITAAISIGGTLAYLTDTDEDVNVMTVGKVKIDQLEYERVDSETADDDAVVQEFHDNKPLYPAITDKNFDYVPGDTYVDWDQIGKNGYTTDIWDPSKINNEQDKMVFVKNKGDYDAYVRTVFGFEANGYTLAQFQELFHLNLNDTDWTWNWAEPVEINGTNYILATATYNQILAPGAITPISLSQIALDSSATNEDIKGFGDTYQILALSQAVQAAGFENPVDALNEAFGAVPPNVPFPDDNPNKGIDVMTAIHYLDGDRTSEQITKKVTNIIFGLNKNYADVVSNYKPVIVDIEQDIPANAYYVKNGSNYQVYILSNDVIYAPRSCRSLFEGMSALKSVNTDNLSFSRTVDMGRAFYNCTALTDLNSTEWDLGNVTTFYYTFGNCKVLKQLDVSKWDVSNVTEFALSFYNCASLTQMDVSNWDVSSATTIRWLFGECRKLTALDVSDWDVRNVTQANNAFYNCRSITELDLSDWDVRNVGTFEGMFGEMHSLTNVKLDNWNPINATSLYSTFYNCNKLQSIDLSGWKMPKLTNLSHTFADCNSASVIDVSGWYTPSLVLTDAMFNDCHSITEVDVSSLDTSNVTVFAQTFEACWALEKIIGLENWKTEKGNDFSEMFSGCGSLKELDLSSFDTRNANSNRETYDGIDNLVYVRFLSGCTKLEKITFSDKFDFDGVGNCPAGYTFVMPSATNVPGWDGNWYHAQTGVGYAPADVPQLTAATYVAVNPNP